MAGNKRVTNSIQMCIIKIGLFAFAKITTKLKNSHLYWLKLFKILTNKSWKFIVLFNFHIVYIPIK